MKLAMKFYYLSAAALLASGAIFLEGPVHAQWSGNLDTLNTLLILYGFPALLGLCLFFIRYRHFEQNKNRLMVFAHAASVVGILWLILWCFVWLAILSGIGDEENVKMLVKHTAYFHLFGVGFAMAGYATGWLVKPNGERAARYLMSAGWAVGYMACFNLYLQPALKWMWAPVTGGLGLVLAAFLIFRQLKRAVEPIKPVA
jgi:hypothetical protein